MRREFASPSATRSGWEAAILAVAFVTVGLAAVVGLTVLVDLFAGSAPSAITALLGMVGLLTFVTLRAYPPGTRIPWVLLFLLTLLTAVIPLLYVTWLWLSGRKWAKAAAAA